MITFLFVEKCLQGKLIDGREVAVKRFSIKSKQGIEEFKNEMMFIVKLQHKNLVKTLGMLLGRS